jgi:hypothetical protein
VPGVGLAVASSSRRLAPGSEIASKLDSEGITGEFGASIVVGICSKGRDEAIASLVFDKTVWAWTPASLKPSMRVAAPSNNDTCLKPVVFIKSSRLGYVSAQIEVLLQFPSALTKRCLNIDNII